MYYDTVQTILSQVVTDNVYAQFLLTFTNYYVITAQALSYMEEKIETKAADI